jgi:hypothetical protein
MPTETTKRTRRFLLRATALGAGAIVAGCGGTSDVVGSHPGTEVSDGGPSVNDSGAVGLGVVDAGLQSDDGGFVHGTLVPEGGGVGLGVVDAGLEINDGGIVGTFLNDAGSNDSGEVGLGVVDAGLQANDGGGEGG